MEQANQCVEKLESELKTLKDALSTVQNSPSHVKQEFPQTPGSLPPPELQQQYDKLALSHAKLVKLRKGDIKSVNLWKESLHEHKLKLKGVTEEVKELKRENQVLKEELKQLKSKEVVHIQTSQTCPESDEISTDQIRQEAVSRDIQSSPPSTKKLLINDSIDLDAYDNSSPSVAREIDPDLENDTRRHEGVVFKQPKPTNLMQWLKVKEEKTEKKKRASEAEVINLDSQGSPKEKKQRTYELTDFVINPAYNDNLDFAYAETVRGSKRSCEHGGECRQCDEFYKMAGPGVVSAAPVWSNQEEYDRGRKMDVEKTINASSKHRNRWTRKPSPPGFWRSDFPSTQEIVEEKKMAEETRRKEVELRYRSAKQGGKWMFRDKKK